MYNWWLGCEDPGSPESSGQDRPRQGSHTRPGLQDGLEAPARAGTLVGPWPISEAWTGAGCSGQKGFPACTGPVQPRALTSQTLVPSHQCGTSHSWDL